MFCKECGNKLGQDAAFCGQCGMGAKKIKEKLSVEYDIEENENYICESCGHTVLPNARFCGKCGGKRAPKKVLKIPRCVDCGEPLMRSAQYCIICGLEYVEAEDGEVYMPSAPSCPICGEEIEEDVAYCTRCGQRLPEGLTDMVKRTTPRCPECKTAYDQKAKYCSGCGKPSFSIAPFAIVEGNTLTCPHCGESKMPLNRKICWKCGVQWTPRPWKCCSCGTENLHLTKNCSKCGAKRQ